MLKKILALLAMLYAAASFAAVDVNNATAAELDGIKGIGPAISGKILTERKKGSFKDWNDFITRVPGVGETNAAKFSAEGMTVNGTGYSKGAMPAKKGEKASAKPAKEEKQAAKPDAMKAKDEKADAKKMPAKEAEKAPAKEEKTAMKPEAKKAQTKAEKADAKKAAAKESGSKKKDKAEAGKPAAEPAKK